MAQETYLGDGVYASFDGYQIKLRAERFGWVDFIYLEPQVLDSLNMYAKSLSTEEPQS